MKQPPSNLNTAWGEELPNRLSETLDEFRARGVRIVDLATTNPHEHGLTFPEDQLKRIVDDAIAKTAIYRPDPLGQTAAREAIAEYYTRHGADADPERILLTPGTSLAYFYALRLLAEPGADILVPKPGYPLFDDIATLCGLRLRHYHLTARSGQWRLDADDLAFQITPRTCAIVTVSPHNPTGMVLSRDEWSALAALCRERDLPLINDEVFSECLTPPLAALPRPRVEEFPLLITLNGLSKMLSLPGWKIAWMKLDGLQDNTARFMTALERLSDAFLPVNELAQAMIPDLLDAGARGAFDRLSLAYAERRALARRLIEMPVCAPEAGVYLCAQIEDSVDDEEFALRALREQHVLVHPGYLYNLPGHIVLTCIARPETLAGGIERLNRML